MVPFLVLVSAAALVPQTPSYAGPREQISKIQVVGRQTVSIQVPTLQTKSPLCDLAEGAVEEGERKVVGAWVKEERDLLREFPQAAKNLFYESKTKLRFDHPMALSFRAQDEHYNGIGAHGMRNCRTYNFGFVAGKPVRFGLGDAFLRDKLSRVLLQEILLGRAGQLEGTDWISEGMVRYLSDEQLNRFWIDKSALVWEFDPYELGSYAAGAFEVRVPRADLKGLIRSDGPLGFWLRSNSGA